MTWSSDSPVSGDIAPVTGFGNPWVQEYSGAADLDAVTHINVLANDSEIKAGAKDTLYLYHVANNN